jgi:hypothetical protein
VFWRSEQPQPDLGIKQDLQVRPRRRPGRLRGAAR